MPYRPFHRRVMRAPFKLAKRILFPEIAKEPGTLILIRHGESLWNYNKTFTGWADPDLSERGFREAEHAARYVCMGVCLLVFVCVGVLSSLCMVCCL